MTAGGMKQSIYIASLPNSQCPGGWRMLDHDSVWMPGDSETIPFFDLLPDWKSKLSIRMVAGLTEVVERKRLFGCGGLI
jgi:hypothetical protein